MKNRTNDCHMNVVWGVCFSNWVDIMV